MIGLEYHDGGPQLELPHELSLAIMRRNIIAKAERPAISRKKGQEGWEKSPGISRMKRYESRRATKQTPIRASSQTFIELLEFGDMAPNDEAERRGNALPTNEADLYQPSTPSLAYRSCCPRSLQPIVRFTANFNSCPALRPMLQLPGKLTLLP